MEFKNFIYWLILTGLIYVITFSLEWEEHRKNRFLFFIINLFSIGVWVIFLDMNKAVFMPGFPIKYLAMITSVQSALFLCKALFQRKDNKSLPAENIFKGFWQFNFIFFGMDVLVIIINIYLSPIAVNNIIGIAFVWAASLLLAWLCARVIIYFMGCGKNKVWAGNLLSGLLLQVVGYIFFRESVYYWLGAYCLILGQLLSLSIYLYLREKRRGKDSAHC